MAATVPASAQHSQVVVDSYRSQPNWRNREGGSELATIDSTVALPALLQRLNSNWKLVQTGKAYWIGYTNDMYAIAAHKEAAIEPLRELATTGSSLDSRIGAVYTLHLIGIRGRVVGRNYEEFTSVPARRALHSLLADSVVGQLAMELLMRDPWASDVPVLLAALELGSPADWVILNALCRYAVPGYPLLPPLPENVGLQKVQVAEIPSRILDAAEYSAWARQVLRAIQRRNLPSITVEEGLPEQPAYRPDDSFTFIGEARKQVRIRDFLYQITTVDYVSTGSRIHYYLREKGVVICSTATARKKVLDWWAAQPATFRHQFNQPKALKFLPFGNRY